MYDPDAIYQWRTEGPDGKVYQWELRPNKTLYARREGRERWRRLAINMDTSTRDKAEEYILGGFMQHRLI